MRLNNDHGWLFAGCLLMLAATAAGAEREDAPAGADKDKQRAARYKQFTELLHGVKLVGNFTVLGRDQGPLAKEEYTIHSVKKLEQGDLWRFNTRIKYGSLDLPIALNLDVQWAGDTPVITLTNVTIPPLGTFSSRVLIYNQKYAGTWTHGEVGGHLFGQLVRVPPKGTDKKKDAEKKKTTPKPQDS